LKLLQERAGNTLEAISVSNDFLSRTQVAQQQMGLYEIKKLLHTKEAFSKLKRPPTEWEKIFASYIMDKGLKIPCLIQRAQKIKLPQINGPVKKWENELNRAFSKEEVQMAKKHMKTCSPFLAIKEM
jgi:hypothetical protein